MDRSSFHLYNEGLSLLHSRWWNGPMINVIKTFRIGWQCHHCLERGFYGVDQRSTSVDSKETFLVDGLMGCAVPTSTSSFWIQLRQHQCHCERSCDYLHFLLLNTAQTAPVTLREIWSRHSLSRHGFWHPICLICTSHTVAVSPSLDKSDFWIQTVWQSRVKCHFWCVRVYVCVCVCARCMTDEDAVASHCTDQCTATGLICAAFSAIVTVTTAKSLWRLTTPHLLPHSAPIQHPAVVRVTRD